jgi:hypothetical protein
VKKISMSDIKNEALQRNFERAGRWFSASPFFKPRLPQSGWKDEDDTLYFVASERGPSHVRKYTVRYVNSEGIINSFSEFQQFSTGAEARRWLKEALS